MGFSQDTGVVSDRIRVKAKVLYPGPETVKDNGPEFSASDVSADAMGTGYGGLPPEEPAALQGGVIRE
ncbi:MAG: hypothetical protein NVS4B2_34860 [Chloroflexota bacterium]